MMYKLGLTSLTVVVASSIPELTIEMEGGIMSEDQETPSRLTCRSTFLLSTEVCKPSTYYF
jgi:hypothetical protein